MVRRTHYLAAIEDALARSPVVAILGPRQSGKTTIAHMVATGRASTCFDLENPRDVSRLTAPLTALEGLSGLVIIDEVQRKPELFEILRVLADRPDARVRYLILGSASPRLVKGVSESLAGRVSFVDLSGFDIREVGPDHGRTLWVRGGFPDSFLAPSEPVSSRWREDFIRTFLERDVPQLGITVPAETLRRFWTMLAHYHAQVWNAADFARSIGSAEATARRYLDILSGAYVVRQVQPWFENLRKRQVKSPKVYIRDSGILHTLLSIESADGLFQHPKLGASWEGFAIEQVIAISGTRDAYFWATHAGAELDLLVFRNGKRIGFEMKYVDAPSTTRSMRTAMADLRLDALYVVCPGSESYALDQAIQVVSIQDLPSVFQVGAG